MYYTISSLENNFDVTVLAQCHNDNALFTVNRFQCFSIYNKTHFSKCVA